ncbi:uncharacterized protein LOC141617632 [Silene latifolia]|uniref:uncharacterized protein LOC141617632 n=1 Tax=Silene latifolia TaxID=37657 RepID=UPI003D787035
MARKAVSKKSFKKSLQKIKSKSRARTRLSFNNCCNLHLDMSSSGKETRIPQSADAKNTKDVNELVGIPVLNLDGIVETVVSDESDQEATGQEEDGTWTTVSGKRRSSKSTPFAASKEMLQLTLEDVSTEIKYWETAAICYVLGGNPPADRLSGFIKGLWGKYKYDKIAFLPNGVFLVRFPTMECLNLVLQQGFPIFENKPLIIKPWTEESSLTKERVEFVPIWVRLCRLGLKFWGKSALSKIAGLVGKFLKTDGANEEKTRLGFARVMLEVKVGQELPDKLYFKDEKGVENCILVEYEWKPVICSSCKGIGHGSDVCRKKQASVQVPVEKANTWVWRPVTKVPGPKPSSVVQPGGLGTATPRSPVRTTLPGGQELQTGQSSLTPGRSFVETVRSGSPTKDTVGGHEGSPVFYSAQLITVHVTEVATGECFLYSVVYGFNHEGDRKDLWDQLKDIKIAHTGPWAVCGDFNSVLNFNERIGRDVTWDKISDFRDCVDFFNLVDLRGQGAFFTWNNKQDPSSRHFSRIDRFLVNEDWLNMYTDAYASFLPKGLFDHNPIVVSKLKSLKKPLRELNRHRFSDIEKSVHMARALLDDLQIRAQQLRNFVLQLKDMNGVLQSGFEGIEDAFLNYYKSLLGESKITANVHLPTVRAGKLITACHSQGLLAPVNPAEIKDSLFSIPANKSPGPDGFSSQFYKDSLDIVGPDIVKAVQDFFRTGKLLKQVNTTKLTLIPKCANPGSVLEFRPIACCNTLYKCISKVLCNRLSVILPDIVSCNQGGFVMGRHIVENVLICQDLVRLYNRKAASPRCLIKIDLRKAYDTVEWVFLRQMLTALKFLLKFIDLIMTCVSTPSFSLNANGSTFVFFQGKRGLRQGDPLSPLLFTLCMEYLSRILAAIAHQDSFKYHPLCRPLQLNHLLFADDLLMSCKGDAPSIMWLLRGFATFSAASGLELNKEKTNIYFNGMAAGIVTDILQVSGFKKGNLPFKYLGIPISSKKLTKNDRLKLMDKIIARIRGLGARKLSYAGRLVLVNYVLSTMHSYWSSIFLIPKGIMRRIEAYCRNYLWSGAADYKKAPNVSWGYAVYQKRKGDWALNSWSWRKISHTFSTFKQAYTNNRWLNNDAEYTVVGGYNWLRQTAPKLVWSSKCLKILQDIIRVQFPLKDLVAWYKNGRGKSKLVRNFTGACHVALMKQVFHSWTAVCRLAQEGGLDVKETASKHLPAVDLHISRGMILINRCVLCQNDAESHKHLFFRCIFSENVWNALLQWMHISCRTVNFWTELKWMAHTKGQRHWKNMWRKACLAAPVYFLWAMA